MCPTHSQPHFSRLCANFTWTLNTIYPTGGLPYWEIQRYDYAGKRGLNLVTAVRPVELAQCFSERISLQLNIYFYIISFRNVTKDILSETYINTIFRIVFIVSKLAMKMHHLHNNYNWIPASHSTIHCTECYYFRKIFIKFETRMWVDTSLHQWWNTSILICYGVLTPILILHLHSKHLRNFQLFVYITHTYYSDAIISAMASQITSVSIVYSTVCSGSYKKSPNLRITGLCEWNSPVTGVFPTQRASNAENVSIWWRHHTRIFVESPPRHIWHCRNG